MAKGKKVLVDAIMAQVDDIELDIDDINQKIKSLLETPKKKKNQSTPESTPD